MPEFVRRLYTRLGARYRWVFLAINVPASVFVALATVWLLASYYDPSTEEFAVLAGATALAAAAAVSFALVRSNAAFAQIVAWSSSGTPSALETIQAWDAAVNFPVRSFQRDALRAAAIVALPSTAVMIIVLDLPWTAAPVLLVACSVAIAYATVLNFATAELLMRPLVEDIAAALPENFEFARTGLPIRKRFVLALPVFTALTGLAVAALVTDHGGTGGLAVALLCAIGVGAALSLELTVLLSRSIADPIATLSAALARVRAGDYAARVPVITSDELGELSDDFNRMAQGLEERERLREAFGTYLDKEVARVILSGRFPTEGVEVDASIMFCDVRDFTQFAERSAATDVVAAINALFETIVPIIDRHGGHVDKFIGDGLLAVFGPPEGLPDHADRAVAAGLDTVEAVGSAALELRIGVGISTGRVVAGSIGGAGRLNFSVIGDAVNVAARVEAATRDTGDDLLITAATRDALTRPMPLVSRGPFELKGKDAPVEVLAPSAAVPVEAEVSR